LRLDHTDVPGSNRNEILVLTDDEGALVVRPNGSKQAPVGKSSEKL